MSSPYLALIDTSTHGRYDISPLFADPLAYSQLVHDLISMLDPDEFDRVAAIDALGFLLGGPIALHFRKPLILVRKLGKLPGAAQQTSFIDYSSTQKGLEVRDDAVPAGSRVLLVDDWVETATQVEAATRLLEQMRGRIAAILAINVDSNPSVAALARRYRLISLVHDL